MKRMLLFAIMAVFIAGLAYAQGGAIGLFSDESAADCGLVDDLPGLVTYFVIHVYTPGATASQFAAPMPACFLAAIWLSDTPYFPVTIGNTQTGVAIGYGACLVSNITLLAVNFFGQGLTPNCCEYPVVPDPAVPSGQIEVVDCNDNLLVANGHMAYINVDHVNCICFNPVEESTWGRVKSLYSE